ncbi:MAG TPA: response regulator transcription factor [Anaerolineales bacterium]|nr:response regulator transcription factor [Anaerolineales bacterium]
MIVTPAVALLAGGSATAAGTGGSSRQLVKTLLSDLAKKKTWSTIRLYKHIMEGNRVKPKNTQITLLVIDSDSLARAGIRSLLSKAKDMEIIGEAGDGHEAQALITQLRPNVLLHDLKMTGMHASELQNWAREKYPEIVSLVLTTHDRDSYLATMMEAGVAGYLSKEESEERLISAIRRAAGGEIIFDKAQRDRIKQWRETVGNKIILLTPREREILQLLAKGMDNKEIGKSLEVSTKTVAYHISHIIAKLQVKSRQEATVWALQHLSDNLE